MTQSNEKQGNRGSQGGNDIGQGAKSGQGRNQDDTARQAGLDDVAGELGARGDAQPAIDALQVGGDRALADDQARGNRGGSSSGSKDDEARGSRGGSSSGSKDDDARGGRGAGGRSQHSGSRSSNEEARGNRGGSKSSGTSGGGSR
jgi:hypothetical protein